MKTKTWKSSRNMKTIHARSLRMLAVVLGSLLVLNLPSRAQEVDDTSQYRTGLKAMSPEQLETFKQTRRKVVQVFPSRLAIQRLNRELAARGLPLFPEEDAAPPGKTTRSIIGSLAPHATPEGGITFDQLLADVDNSAQPGFPEIRSQGSLGSCATWAITYYQLTHQTALFYGWNNHNAENTTKFSPRWSYNMVNNGVNEGTWITDLYDLLEQHGAATWEQFPYDGVDYTRWCLDPKVWQSAIQYRCLPVEYIDIDTVSEEGIAPLKQVLANGDVVTFATHISSWAYTTVSDDKSTSADNPYVRQQICAWLSGTLGSHLMTIVGYNDDLWCDINKNRRVDPGEKGAFKIANSWGPGWKNGGFCWLAYDALYPVSRVPGGPTGTRPEAIWGYSVYRIDARNHYEPKMVAEFTVNHAKRNQLRLHLGVSDPDTTVPEVTWFPGAITFQGGPLAFDGSTVACDGTFVFDLTDILYSGGSLKRYYLGMFDSTQNNPATLLGFKIRDLTAAWAAGGTLVPPLTADAAQVSAYVDYTFSGPTLMSDPPVAVIGTSPVLLVGSAPFTVTFDGSQSCPNGTITDYTWYFGYGAGPFTAGPTATYTYDHPGIYSAKLTVTDTAGRSSSSAVVITVGANPERMMHVEDIVMALKPSARKTQYASATVKIANTPGVVVAGATVSGHWSGLTQDLDSGVTDSSGSVTLNSDTVSKSASGTFTFTVDDVTLHAWQYDPAANVKTSNSISTGASR